MTYILAGILAQLVFVLIYFRWKTLRRRGADTVAILAVFGYAAPALALLAFFSFDNFQQNLPPSYLIAVILWLVPCMMMNYGEAFLFRFQGLAEYTGIRTAMVALLALLLDFAVFDFRFAPVSLAGIAVTMTGGLILRGNRDINVAAEHKIHLGKALLITVMIAATTSVMMAFFKYALSQQDSYIFHAGFSQTLLFSCFLAVGYRKLKKCWASEVIGRQDVIYITGLIIVYAVLESYAYVALPLVVLVMLDLIHTLCFVGADLKNREITITRSTVAGMALVLAGIAVLAVYRYL